MAPHPPKRNEGRVVHTDLWGRVPLAPMFEEGLDSSITSKVTYNTLLGYIVLEGSQQKMACGRQETEF